MTTRLAQLSYRLDSGELISLEDGAGWVLEVSFGNIWLTASGRAQDIWLRADEQRALDGAQALVIEAVNSHGDSRVTLRKTGAAVAMPVSAVTPRVTEMPERRLSGWLARLRRAATAWRPAIT